MKNLTFAIGLSWLIYGALFYGMQDWDLPVSLIMAFCTYFTAEWVIGVIRRREYRQWFKAAFLVWFSVAGSYNAYWVYQGKADWIIEYQWVTSLCLYLLCGMVWSYAQYFLDILARFRVWKAQT